MVGHPSCCSRATGTDDHPPSSCLEWGRGPPASTAPPPLTKSKLWVQMGRSRINSVAPALLNGPRPPPDTALSSPYLFQRTTNGWLKTTDIYSLPVLEARSPRSRGGRAAFPKVVSYPWGFKNWGAGTAAGARGRLTLTYNHGLVSLLKPQLIRHLGCHRAPRGMENGRSL